MNVQNLALQKYTNHHQILKLFKAGRNVQSLNKIRPDEREEKQLATAYFDSESGAKRNSAGNIQDCFSTFMDNW
jgi:ethanolamine utilization cobalamin adenosyltransferase